MKRSLLIADFFILEIMTETPEERTKRFQAMSSYQRQDLLRQKMKAQGLVEGSGVQPLSSYDTDEVWGLIQITSYFPEMQAKQSGTKEKAPKKRKSLIAWIIFAIALGFGMIFYYQQFPSPEIRRDLSVDGMFFD